MRFELGSKALLEYDGQLAMVEGDRGMLKLPGGGLKRENHRQGLDRELREEIRNADKVIDMDSIQEAFSHRAICTPEDKPACYMAYQVYAGRLLVPPALLEPGDVPAIYGMMPAEIIGNPNVQTSAQSMVSRAYPHINPGAVTIDVWNLPLQTPPRGR